MGSWQRESSTLANFWNKHICLFGQTTRRSWGGSECRESSPIASVTVAHSAARNRTASALITEPESIGVNAVWGGWKKKPSRTEPLSLFSCCHIQELPPSSQGVWFTRLLARKLGRHVLAAQGGKKKRKKKGLVLQRQWPSSQGWGEIHFTNAGPVFAAKSITSAVCVQSD